MPSQARRGRRLSAGRGRRTRGHRKAASRVRRRASRRRAIAPLRSSSASGERRRAVGGQSRAQARGGHGRAGRPRPRRPSSGRHGPTCPWPRVRARRARAPPPARPTRATTVQSDVVSEGMATAMASTSAVNQATTPCLGGSCTRVEIDELDARNETLERVLPEAGERRPGRRLAEAEERERQEHDEVHDDLHDLEGDPEEQPGPGTAPRLAGGRTGTARGRSTCHQSTRAAPMESFDLARHGRRRAPRAPRPAGRSRSTRRGSGPRPPRRARSSAAEVPARESAPPRGSQPQPSQRLRSVDLGDPDGDEPARPLSCQLTDRDVLGDACTSAAVRSATAVLLRRFALPNPPC